MINVMTYDTLGRNLAETVPEIRGRYESLLREWDDEGPGPHVIFGDVLNPYLLALLAAPESAAQHAEALRRIFAVLEQMARHDDPLVREVVSATVCERLGDDLEALAIALGFMGDATRRLSDEVEAFWSTGGRAQTPVASTGDAAERTPRPRRCRTA